MQQLIAETALLETRVAERDAKLRDIRTNHTTQIRHFGEQIINLRDSVWTESQKATALDRELESSKETLSILQKELERVRNDSNSFQKQYFLMKSNFLIKDILEQIL
jgi:peptidoglycan hydrolase CwlO-like protein